ncbi:MAG: adenylate/guanylate cyclase domain-containing protein [Gammaproteobacteria bacterium]|nr:adenylate/guanylate cyclase domain-containing protein [Gammaproteobacteria bacterium]
MPLFDRIESHASQDRLERLIEERLLPGADTAAIDAVIWKLFGERWAVMFTDLIGFSRNVAEFGIVQFLQTIHISHRLLVPCLERGAGILLKTEGDSMLVIFRSPADAVRAAIDMQRCLSAYNAVRPRAEHVLLGVGVGYGDVLRIGDADVFGAEVNAAAKLGEDTAVAGEILLTAAVHEAVAGEGHDGFEALDVAPPGTHAAYRLRYQC